MSKTVKYIVECQEKGENDWYHYCDCATMTAACATMERKIKETINIQRARVVEQIQERNTVREIEKPKPKFIDPDRLVEISKSNSILTDNSGYIWTIRYINPADKLLKLVRKDGEMLAYFGDIYEDGDCLVVSDDAGNTRKFFIYALTSITEF